MNMTRYMFFQIIRKSKLGSLFFSLFKPFVQNKPPTLNSKTIEEMILDFQKLSKKEKSNTYVQKRNNKEFYDLDIIIPVFNVEDYLEECLLSILRQDSGNYKVRLIIVNDGSTDGCKNILEKYSTLENILLINQTNMGLSGARNTGLENINSRFLMFVDSDDRLNQGYVKNMLDKAFSTNADIVQGPIRRFNDKHVLKCRPYKTGELNPIKDLKGFACGKIIKSSFFDNLQFPKNYWYEDTIMRMVVFKKTKKNYGISDAIYEYRLNNSSITGQAKLNEKSIDTVLIYHQILLDYKLHNLTFDYDDLDYFLYHVKLSAWRIFNLKKNVRRDIFTFWTKMLQQIDLPGFAPQHSFSDLYNALKTSNFTIYEWACYIK